MGKLASILAISISCLLVLTSDVCARKQVPNADDHDEELAAFHSDICKGNDQKVMKLKLYVQDLRIGNKNTTVFEVAKASITPRSRSAFGSVHVLDDLVTEGPAYTSKVLGRCQGLTTNADLSTFGIAMNLNFYFTSGRLNGSTLSILGRNAVTETSRELPIAGGTGAFRYAQGYAIQTTYSMDFKTSYAVLEYNIFTTYNSRFTQVDVADM